MNADFSPSKLTASQKEEGEQVISEQLDKNQKIKLDSLPFLDSQINFPMEFVVLAPSLSLEIVLPFNDFSLESYGKILYYLYNKLNYLFSYLDYQIRFQN